MSSRTIKKKRHERKRIEEPRIATKPISESRDPAIAADSGRKDQGRRLAALICAGLFLLVWAVFGQTVGHGFINFDDDETVYDSPAVPRGLNLEGVRWAFTHTVVGHWDPLTTLTHMLDCQLYGLRPSGHHFGNVLLHAIAVMFLFLVLRRMTGAVWRSAFVAAVFAIHPLRAESVAWITERKDVLSGVFFALTLWTYTGYVRNRSALRHALVLTAFALGLMSKSMLVTAPFLLLLLDYWPLGRWEAPSPCRWLGIPRNLIIEKLPIFALSAISAAVQVAAARQMITPLEKISLPSRIGNAFVSYAAYLWQMIWPANLAALYPHPGNALPAGQAALAFLLLAAVSTVAFVERARTKWLVVGWLWYLGMLVPVIGIIQSGEIARADRYTYLPQIGVYLIVSWGFAEFAASRRWNRTTVAATAALVLLALSWRAAIQTTYWRDSEALWKHTLASADESWTAQEDLGLALSAQGKIDEAITHWERALKLRPRSTVVLTNMAVSLLREERFDEAIGRERQVLELEPSNVTARTGLGNALLRKGDDAGAIREYHVVLGVDPNYADAHYSLGFALAGSGNLDEAIREYRAALKLRANYPDAHYNLGAALSKQGRVDDAIAEYREALEYRPDFADVHYDLGILFGQTGRMDEAIAELRAAVSAKPNFADAENNLGAALNETGKADEAIPHFRRAIELTPAGINARLNLGMTLAGKGQLDDAITQFESILEIDPDHAEAKQQLERARQMKRAVHGN